MTVAGDREPPERDASATEPRNARVPAALIPPSFLPPVVLTLLPALCTRVLVALRGPDGLEGVFRESLVSP